MPRLLCCGRERTERVRNVLRHNYLHKRERGAVAS
jgi:hypothetical protein